MRIHYIVTRIYPQRRSEFSCLDDFGPRPGTSAYNAASSSTDGPTMAPNNESGVGFRRSLPLPLQQELSIKTGIESGENEPAIKVYLRQENPMNT